MLIKQVNQKNVIFVSIGILKILVLSMSHLCNGCHDLMQKVVSFNDVAIVYVKGSAYRIHFWYMSKDNEISIMNNSNLIDEKGVLHFLLLCIKNELENVLSKKQRCDTK